MQGVLIIPTAEMNPALEAMRDRGVPVVLLDRRAAGPDQCSVAVDDDHLHEQLALEPVPVVRESSMVRRPISSGQVIA